MEHKIKIKKKGNRFPQLQKNSREQIGLIGNNCVKNEVHLKSKPKNVAFTAIQLKRAKSKILTLKNTQHRKRPKLIATSQLFLNGCLRNSLSI